MWEDATESLGSLYALGLFLFFVISLAYGAVQLLTGRHKKSPSTPQAPLWRRFLTAIAIGCFMWFLAWLVSGNLVQRGWIGFAVAIVLTTLLSIFPSQKR